MKAVVYCEPRKFNIKDVDVPIYGDHQVLIRVRACGICKTDLHIHNGKFISKFPLIPGHELSGVVEKVGSKVTGLKQGDRVVADPTIFCGDCYYCRRGKPLYCENFSALGVTTAGGFAEYVVADYKKVFTFSDVLTFDEAAFAEPTACAVHGMDMIDAQPGDDVLIFGSGPTGIILAQLLRYGGATNIVVAAPTKFKLDIIEELGIGRTVQVDKNDYSLHQRKIKKMFPKGFDIIIDATGVSSVVEQCVEFAKNGSKIVVYGVCGEEEKIKISPYEIYRKELKIIGSFSESYCFDRAIKYLENRIVKVDRLITHKFGLSDYGKALDIVKSSSNKIKVMVNP